MLVDELKEELCRAISLHEDEECLEVVDTRKGIDEEFVLDIRNDHFNGSEEIEKEPRHDKIAEEIECETEDLLCRIFDG